MVSSHTHHPLPSQSLRGGAHTKNHRRLTDIMHRLSHTPHSGQQNMPRQLTRKHGSKNPSSRRPPLTTGTQSLQGPPTPPLLHRSRSLSSYATREISATAAVGATAVTGPHSCCTSTASTASSAGAGVVPAIFTMMREPSMVVTVGGLGAGSTRPHIAIRASCETNHNKAKGDSGPQQGRVTTQRLASWEGENHTWQAILRSAGYTVRSASSAQVINSSQHAGSPFEL